MHALHLKQIFFSLEKFERSFELCVQEKIKLKVRSLCINGRVKLIFSPKQVISLKSYRRYTVLFEKYVTTCSDG